MKIQNKFALALTAISCTSLAEGQKSRQLMDPEECKPLDTVDNFDLEAYASKTWYSHQQAENAYLPIKDNFCVRADYGLKEEPTELGYTVDVKNRAFRDGENESIGNFCAFYDNDQRSKLAVAPCFLPKVSAGPAILGSGIQ